MRHLAAQAESVVKRAARNQLNEDSAVALVRALIEEAWGAG